MPTVPVIDFHVHINPFWMVKPGPAESLRKHQKGFASLQRFMKDPSAFVALLDAQNIERACLINYVAPDVMGYTPAVNEWIASYAAHAPDRLVPFGGLHPKTTKDPKKEVDRLLRKLELKGIKIHGPHSLFWPNDYKAGRGALKVLYEACQDEGVPVMFHTGTSIFPGARVKYGDPLALDDVAVDFPQLKIVLAHAGRPFWMEEAQFLARRHPNVFLDISSIPPKSLLEYLPRLEQLADKAIFGSDWPGPNVPSIRENADAVGALLSVEARRKILHENAKRLLG